MAQGGKWEGEISSPESGRIRTETVLFLLPPGAGRAWAITSASQHTVS